jgi:hypothetical protein
VGVGLCCRSNTIGVRAPGVESSPAPFGQGVDSFRALNEDRMSPGPRDAPKGVALQAAGALRPEQAQAVADFFHWMGFPSCTTGVCIVADALGWRRHVRVSRLGG